MENKEDLKEDEEKESDNLKCSEDNVAKSISESVEIELNEREKIIQNIIDLKKEKASLKAENVKLQQKLSEAFKGPFGNEILQEAELPQDAARQMFLDILSMIDAKHEEINTFEISSRKEIDSLKNEILEKEREYKEINSRFKSLKERVALKSVNTNTGDKFSKKEVQELLQKEQEENDKLLNFQLEYIKNKYNLQDAVQRKQSLVEGPVDYSEYDVMCTEIENNREVSNQLEQETKELKQKMSSMVNVIGHLTQKHYFIQKQKGAAELKDKFLEEELNEMRDNLFEEKKKFNTMKERNEDLQHRYILLQHPKLIEDYKTLLAENENATNELQQLKNEYATSMKIATSSKNKLL